MHEEALELATPDGVADGMLIHNADGPAPGIIFLTDIRGIRPAPLDMARRLATNGYTVLVPNVFYRSGRAPLFDFDLRTGGERTMQRIAELRAPLTPDAVARDADAYVDFLATQPSVAPGPMGVVGYCATGEVALRIAAARPDRIAAAASFHGGGLFNDSPTSPHLVLPRVTARLYFGHADDDRSMPTEAIASLEDALHAWGGAFESEVYAGARHGWTVPDSAAYDEAAAGRAFGKLEDLLAATLL